ncbi:MAG: baseplate complex protein [Paraglaciecola chathamensis]
MTIKLVLDGNQLPGSELRLSVNYSIESDDLSGQGSSTTDAETGDKAQIVRVRVLIPHAKPEDLKTIRDLAGQRDEDGSRHVFTIVNETTEAMSIRQVKFNAEFLVKEDDAKKAWWVNFILKEHRSVAEKVQEQQDLSEKKEVEQTTPNATEVDQEKIQQLSTVEQWLQQGENWFTDEN